MLLHNIRVGVAMRGVGVVKVCVCGGGGVSMCVCVFVRDRHVVTTCVSLCVTCATVNAQASTPT